MDDNLSVEEAKIFLSLIEPAVEVCQKAIQEVIEEIGLESVTNLMNEYKAKTQQMLVEGVKLSTDKEALTCLFASQGIGDGLIRAIKLTIQRNAPFPPQGSKN